MPDLGVRQLRVKSFGKPRRQLTRNARPPAAGPYPGVGDEQTEPALPVQCSWHGIVLTRAEVTTHPQHTGLVKRRHAPAGTIRNRGCRKCRSQISKHTQPKPIASAAPASANQPWRGRSPCHWTTQALSSARKGKCTM